MLLSSQIYLYGDLEEVDPSKISAWDTSFSKTGDYNFGISDNESIIKLREFNGVVYAQHYFGMWKKVLIEDTLYQTVYNVEVYNLKNPKILDDLLIAEGVRGEFVKYKNDKTTNDPNELDIGLIIYESPILPVSELGLKSKHNYFGLEGKYKFASERLLDKKELLELELNELKIMRNEIYARYGHQFKKGGEMDKYFSKKEWYMKNYGNVESYLSDLERKNIELIKNIEKEKQGF